MHPFGILAPGENGELTAIDKLYAPYMLRLTTAEGLLTRSPTNQVGGVESP